jgi:hypothetical protein
VATAPTFVTSANSVWNTTTTPKTASVTVQTGDILVAGVADENITTLNTPTNDGAALTWTLAQAAAGASNCAVSAWTTTADSNRTIVVSATHGATEDFGLAVLVFRGSDGVGNSGKVEGDTTANFTASVTTAQANSAIAVFAADFAPALGARTWLTNAGAFTELVGVAGDVSGHYAVRVGYHADAGAAAAYAVGNSAPGSDELWMRATAHAVRRAQGGLQERAHLDPG